MSLFLIFKSVFKPIISGLCVTLEPPLIPPLSLSLSLFISHICWQPMLNREGIAILPKAQNCSLFFLFSPFLLFLILLPILFAVLHKVCQGDHTRGQFAAVTTLFSNSQSINFAVWLANIGLKLFEATSSMLTRWLHAVICEFYLNICCLIPCHDFCAIIKAHNPSSVLSLHTSNLCAFHPL